MKIKLLIRKNARLLLLVLAVILIGFLAYLYYPEISFQLAEPSLHRLNGNWQVISINGQQVPPNSRITMIVEDGEITGGLSTNSWNTVATARGKWVRFGNFRTTLICCDDEFSNQFLVLLSQKLYEFVIEDNGQLVFKDFSGPRVVFQRVGT